MAGALAGTVGDLLGQDVVDLRPVAGGDIGRAYRARLAGGSAVFVKVTPGAPGGFVAAEARGLAALAAVPGGVPVPAVRAAAGAVLVLDWVEAGPPTADAAAALGRALARTHLAGRPTFGAAEPGWIGSLRLPEGSVGGGDSWPEFYGRRRLVPYARAAAERGRLSAADRVAIDAVVDRLAELAGDSGAEPPRLVHGDLWSGNVLWAVDGVARVVDPAVQGGHRETDLAMLALFGCPYLDVLLTGYQQVARLAPGWRDRVSLHQLHPLLVHAVLFGGGYGARAGAQARAALARLG